VPGAPGTWEAPGCVASARPGGTSSLTRRCSGLASLAAELHSLGTGASSSVVPGAGLIHSMSGAVASTSQAPAARRKSISQQRRAAQDQAPDGSTIARGSMTFLVRCFACALTVLLLVGAAYALSAASSIGYISAAAALALMVALWVFTELGVVEAGFVAAIEWLRHHRS